MIRGAPIMYRYITMIESNKITSTHSCKQHFLQMNAMGKKTTRMKRIKRQCIIYIYLFLFFVSNWELQRERTVFCQRYLDRNASYEYCTHLRYNSFARERNRAFHTGTTHHSTYSYDISIHSIAYLQFGFLWTEFQLFIKFVSLLRLYR